MTGKRQAAAEAKERVLNIMGGVPDRVDGHRKAVTAIIEELPPEVWRTDVWPRWVFVAVRPDDVWRFVEALQGEGIRTYVPLALRVSGEKLIAKPVFPRRVFVQVHARGRKMHDAAEAFFDLVARLDLRDYVTDVRQPLPVTTEAQIDRFRSSFAEKQRPGAPKAVELPVGSTVRVASGVFKGEVFEVEGVHGGFVSSAALSNLFEGFSRVSVSARLLEKIGSSGE